MRCCNWLFAVGLMLTLTSVAGAAEGFTAEDRAELPHFVDEIMVRWHVPGAAVAVVNRDGVVFSGGFGYRGLDRDHRVTESTLFGLGSATKAFTAAAVGRLVDERKLDWDQTVRSVLPGFAVADAMTTLHATLRDLLAHRTGLPRHDAVWYRSDLTRAELFSRLRYLESECELRQCFTYSNLMYMVAGHVVEEVSGTSWEEFVGSRILRPLGMRRTTFGAPPFGEVDYARPHERDEGGEPVEVPLYKGWAAGPAGSMYTCASDMAAWLRFQLGAPFDDFVISAETLAETHRPQMVVDRPATPAFPMTSYGLGWFVQTYRGRLLLWHTGSIDGYYSLVGFLPFDDLGFVILTNRSENHVPEVVSRWIIDRSLDLEEIDWHSYLVEQDEAIRAAKEAEVAAIIGRFEAREGVRPPASEFVGRYDHPAYGELTLTEADGELRGVFHGIAGNIRHLAGDLFLFEVRGEVFEDRFLLAFRRDASGHVASVSSPLAGRARPVVFAHIGHTAEPPTARPQGEGGDS